MNQGGFNKMKKFVLVAVCAALTALLAGNATAEELRGRVAVTAKLGITNPADGESSISEGKLIIPTDAGVIGGGGILFGVDDNLAMELDVTRSAYHSAGFRDRSGAVEAGFGTAGVTDVSVGAQYRLPERQRLVPYAGAGVDILISDVNHTYTDTVVGAHLAAGIDYMAMRQVALTAELKGVEAFSTDVRTYGGNKIGEFDPSNISFTVGARFFFN
jgi:outer membrane protein